MMQIDYTDYQELEQRAAAAQTSVAIVWAIESVSSGTIDDEDSPAYRLWAGGGRETEVLDAVPDGTDDDILYWGGKFARRRDGQYELI